jgi:glycosyltransferase involved in cell wall biosynthesis
MRILYLLTQDLESPSGLGRYYPLALEMSRLGHQVTIAALHADYASLSTTRFQDGNLEICYVAPMHVRKHGNIKRYYSTRELLQITARSTWLLTRAALQIDADIVHICKPHPMNSLAGLFSRLVRHTTLVLDCDDYEAGSGNFSGRWQKSIVTFFEKNVPRRVQMVTTHTNFLRENLIAWGVADQKIVYLPNGIDTGRFAPSPPEIVETLRSRYGLHGKQVIAFIGSLSRPSHPIQLLIDAFKLCRQALPDSVLLIVGGGDDFDALREQVAASDLASAVRFCGRVPPAEVPAYYALAHVTIDPVYDDPAARGRSPLKLFESWACGVAFISADVGERRGLLGDPPAGVLVEPGNPDALADAIVAILSNAQKREELVARGRARVKNYTRSGLARQMEQAYRDLIQRERGG